MIARAGGSTNAYTRAEETNYYFSIMNDQMKEAL
jgi:secreted Zn-dependent insulinase-like peptidase